MPNIKNGQFTMLIGAEETRIEVRDGNAGALLCRVTLTPEQLSLALSRLMHVPCEVETFDLSKIGKFQEHKKFDFKLPKYLSGYDKNKEEIHRYVMSLLSGTGWVADRGFSSKDTFYSIDGVDMARCTIRRWIGEIDERSEAECVFDSVTQENKDALIKASTDILQKKGATK